MSAGLGVGPDTLAWLCGQTTDRIRANYAYSASPDDPNEVSFAKGDVLDVVDTTGKWYQVRTPAGQVGVSRVGSRRAERQLTCPDRSFQLPHLTVI